MSAISLQATRTFLDQFISSSSKLALYTSCSTSLNGLQSTQSRINISKAPLTLYVLDSSFNPPTVAHLKLCTTALTNDSRWKYDNGQATRSSHSSANIENVDVNLRKQNNNEVAREDHRQKRLLLLLSVQNADKADVRRLPAPLEYRLQMMTCFAQEITQIWERHRSPYEQTDFGVEIAVTKLPYFVDKAAEIAHPQGIYQDSSPEIEQVHILGQDTLARLFNAKYYENDSLSILSPLFAQHRIRVTYRPNEDKSASHSQQQDQDRSQDVSSHLNKHSPSAHELAGQDPAVFLRMLSKGGFDHIGASRQWANQIDLVEAHEQDDDNYSNQLISSTKARTAAKIRDMRGLKKFLPAVVFDYVLKEDLYRSPEGS